MLRRVFTGIVLVRGRHKERGRGGGERRGDEQNREKENENAIYLYIFSCLNIRCEIFKLAIDFIPASDYEIELSHARRRISYSDFFPVRNFANDRANNSSLRCN